MVFSDKIVIGEYRAVLKAIRQYDIPITTITGNSVAQDGHLVFGYGKYLHRNFVFETYQTVLDKLRDDWSVKWKEITNGKRNS